VEQYRKVRSTFDGPILLDGHFVVPTKEGPHPVSADVFAALNVDAFVIVETDLEVVLARLRLRPTQSWWDGDRESVASLMNLEMAQAEVIAQALDRPLVRIDGETMDGLPEIRRLLKSVRTEYPPESRLR
jgi:adenylate kinase